MFRVTRSLPGIYHFSVFNHTTCHTIKKTESGVWVAVEHRFGRDNLPLVEIGNAIDAHYHEMTWGSWLGKANLSGSA